MASDLIASSPPLPQHELDQLHNSANFGPDVASPVLSGYGSQSVTSDNVSMSGLSFSLPSYMTSIQPRPCYASRESASRAATELYRQHKELGLDDDSEGETDRVLISETATGYVNSFLDKLLHDILANAQSTQLPQLRSATADVLRRTLGKEAVAYADANLEDLLAAEPEDDTEDTASTPTDSVTRWDLEYIWKRARLRVMMRSENSDFDIDDDEHHAQEAGLSGLGRRFGDNASAVISLHGEIFLAGVLDFVSDHVFAVAIIPASMRRRRTSKKSPTLNADPTVLYIDETDLEKGVLNSPLDRHWRAWRKSTRSRGSYPTSPRHGHSYSDTSSPETTRAGSTQWGDGPYHNANTDLATPRGMPGEYIETPAVELPQRQLVPEADYPEHVMASNIPLPIGQHDVDEIETPGLAKDPEDKANMLERPSAKSNANLRNSLGITTFNPDDTGIPTSEDPSTFGTATVISQTYARSNDGHMAVNPDTVSALIGDRSLEGSEKIVNEPSDGPTSPHPERTSSLVNPISSPTSTTKRNREAAVGMGFPNGISLPQELPANEARSENISEKLSTHDDPRLRAASPSSETEGSEVMSPRDFMAARNLQGTRSARSDSAPQPVPTAQASPRTQIPSPLRSRLQTSGLQDRAENSPVSPLSASELGTERPTESSKYGAVAGAAVGERGTLVRKTSAPAARVTDDLARARGSPKIPDIARGSPKMRQTSLQDRESLRRIAVERNGSLVSLVDETSHKPRNKTPLTSSSIVSAEDFDSLLNGSDTIKMTLSPSSVRESPSQPSSRSGSIDHSALAKMNGSKDDLSSILKKRTGVESGGRSPSLRGVSAGSPEKSKSIRGRSGSAATDKTSNSVNRPTVRNKSRTRAGFMAREATVQTDSTRDFADFIRSTGPDREPRTLVPALASRPSFSSEAARQPSISQDSQRQPSVSQQSVRQPSISQLSQRQPSLSALSTKSPTRQGSLGGPQVSDGTGIKYKRNYAPREARGSEPSGNDGLIDFIRSGPTPAKQNLPSKDIAPFRYSMDSDEMREAVVNLDDPDGHRASISTMNTMQTMMTYNSHAPLVNPRQPSISTSPLGGSTPKVAPPQAQPKKSNYVANSEGVMRYRNKDPYAIDFSDDEEEEAGGSSADQAIQAGSLGPFLTEATEPSKKPQPLQPPSRTSPAVPDAAPPKPTAPAPLSPAVQNGSATPQPGRVVIPRNPNRPKLEVRSAGGGGERTRNESASTKDLADFFKNSAPPPEPSAPSPNIGGSDKSIAEKKEKTKFWSRKRYVDMP